MVLGVVLSSYKDLNDNDYILSSVQWETYGVKNLGEKRIENYQGLSGGGLWKLVERKPLLVGIAIAQDLTGYKNGDKEGMLYFHGPKSILSFLKSIS